MQSAEPTTSAGNGRSSYFDYRRYAFAPPPELAGRSVSHKVAVVGAGPVGLAIALELALYGVKSVIIEEGDSESDGSRAACISRRSMEILAKIGIIDAFEAVALPWTSGTSFFRGEPVFRLAMPHSPDERFFPMANLQQNLLERMMIEQAARTGLVEIRWKNALIGLRQDDGQATLTVRTPVGDYDLVADHVVAADGARSATRRLTGLKLSGTSYSGRYLIADIHMRSPSPTERRAWFDSEANRGSTILMHRQPHDIWRVDYQLRDEDDETVEMEPSRLRQRIQAVLDMAGETAPWDLEWVSIYKAHCLCLDRYVHGRIAFVGDAAHLVPIFGVRGLNSGLADANNLGWKLAVVLDGGAPIALLDTYSRERRAATMEIFREAGKSTRFMTPPSRGYALMRQASLSLALRHSWAGALANPRQSAPYDYAASSLNIWAADEADFAAGPRAGAPLASVRTGDGFLHDRLGPRPTLLHFARDGEAVDDLEAASARLGIDLLAVGRTADLEDGDGGLARAYDGERGASYLVRPDWHVAGRTRRRLSQSDLAAAVETMRGYHG